MASKVPLLAGLGDGELGSEGQHVNPGTCGLELGLAVLRVLGLDSQRGADPMKVTPRVALGTEGCNPRQVNKSADETELRSPGCHRVSSAGDSHRQRIFLSMSGRGLGWVGRLVAPGLPGSGSGQGRRGRFLLAVALGTGVHVVPDTDGLFEQAFHAAEVHAAVHQALHSAAGILHGVYGALALLLPPLHICLVLGQLWQRAAHVFL